MPFFAIPKDLNYHVQKELTRTTLENQHLLIQIQGHKVTSTHCSANVCLIMDNNEKKGILMGCNALINGGCSNVLSIA